MTENKRKRESRKQDDVKEEGERIRAKKQKGDVGQGRIKWYLAISVVI
jgi:hypothetical protein